MSRTDIHFIVGNQPSRKGLLASPTGKVTLVPVFAAEPQGKALKLARALTHQAELSGFKADAGQALASVSNSRTNGGTTLVHFGLGSRSKFSVEAWRNALVGGIKQVRSLKTDSVTLSLPANLVGSKALFGSLSLHEIGVITAETIARVLYTANHYKTEGVEPQTLKTVFVNASGLNATQHKELIEGIEAGSYIGACVNLARDTANEPPNICTPIFMAELAQRVAAESNGTIVTTIFDRDACARFGMNAFLAVAKGSKVPPKFIVMDYTPLNCPADGPVLGLVGKSVTFDSGGLDIKPADGMRDMKYDMCGGADVIAAMRAIARLGLPIRVKAFCAATENMTGSEAYRPGDVYTSLDGRSYEIDNTDAEGRLTLVDAISYARIHGKVTHVVDYATLTGAILVALGDITAGVFSNNQAFASAYLAAAGSMGEEAFQMPTNDKYKALNKSTIADMKNSGGRMGGSITAALFVLSAARDLPAVHVDIAGVSFRSKEVDADPAGGTGWGVRTLVALAANLAKTA